MDQIHGEISDAVFEDEVLEGGVRCCEGGGGGGGERMVGEERESGEDCGWGTVEERDEAA